MSALKAIWEQAMVLAKDLHDGTERSIATGRMVQHDWRPHYSRLSAWGKRRWAPRLSDAELLALAERNVRLARGLLELPPTGRPPTVADWTAIFRLSLRAEAELSDVLDIMEHGRPL